MLMCKRPRTPQRYVGENVCKSSLRALKLPDDVYIAA